MYALAIMLTLALLMLGFGSTVLMLARRADMFTSFLRQPNLPRSPRAAGAALRLRAA